MNTLYRFYDANDRLLYVGRTVDPGSRLSDHRREKPWWSAIARIQLEHYPDPETLASVERHAITIQRPLHNIAMNDGPPLDLNLEALAEGCQEHEDDSPCGAPVTHIGTPDYHGGIFVCTTHARYYTIAIPLTH